MHVGPIIAVTDLARARQFYEQALGLDGRETPGGWVIRADDGTVIYLLPEVADAGSASWPVASFRVGDIKEKVRELRSRSVPFLTEADVPFDLDDDGISVTGDLQVAWMRDPDGSVLTIFQLDSARPS
jgi:catechol 2,3-dioxygenase-like lactoylglutathione lyase family enzyme